MSDAIRKLAAEVAVVVCAQGSMAAVLPEFGDVGVPVLTSPGMGIESAGSRGVLGLDMILQRGRQRFLAR